MLNKTVYKSDLTEEDLNKILFYFAVVNCLKSPYVIYSDTSTINKIYKEALTERIELYNKNHPKT